MYIGFDVSLMNETKRHAAFLDVQHEHYPNARALELARSCSTLCSPVLWRWGGSFIDLTAILDTLSIFENDNDVETSLAATSLLVSLQTRKFVTFLVFSGREYEYSDF